MVRRGGQILPFTLTELLVLLFFGLALALVHEVARRVAAEKASQGYSELGDALTPLGDGAVQQVAGTLQRIRKEFPEEFHELTRRLEETFRMRRQLSSYLVKAGYDSVHVDTASATTLVDSLTRLAERVQQRAEDLATILRVADEENAGLTAAAGAIKRLERENEDLRGQVQYFKGRIGNGLDHPPCWADPEGRPEYAYEATLRAGRIDLKAVWPDHRADDAERIPGMLAAPGRSLSHAEFSRRVLPVFQWSQKQQPECRHFVRIVDEVEGGESKDAFKRGLLTVERFFYKYLVN